MQTNHKILELITLHSCLLMRQSTSILKQLLLKISEYFTNHSISHQKSEAAARESKSKINMCVRPRAGALSACAVVQYENRKLNTQKIKIKVL